MVNAYFSGYGSQGDRKNAIPLNYKIRTKITPAGFSGGDERSDGIFYPPCCFTLAITITGKVEQHIPVSQTELY